MLETETHYNATTSTVSCCHTSCDLLDVGTVRTRWSKTSTFDNTVFWQWKAPLLSTNVFSHRRDTIFRQL